MLLPPEIQIKTAKFESKYSVPVTVAMTKKHQLQYYLITMEISLILEQMPYKNMHKLLKMEILQCFSKM